MPTIYVIAGPNGVGKTTFVERYLPEEIRQLEFVNADLIARGLSPFDPESISAEAGRFALLRSNDVWLPWKKMENWRFAIQSNSKSF